MHNLEVQEPASVTDVERQVNEYIVHLEIIATVFTDHARELGLGVRLDATGAIEAARKGTGFARVMRFAQRADDSGVLHGAQLMTALACIGELLTSPHQNGLVLGAMQSGKTTTSIAFQFAGPIVYLLTGHCLYPIYLITSHTSQEDQTKIEITRFLEFYGELSVVKDDENHCTLNEYVRFAKRATVDPAFTFSPTINTYREHVLKKSFPDTMVGPRLEDFIQRRAPGESIKRIVDICRRASEKGFAPLLIIDEPQFGASDRFVRTDDDEIERRPCVLVQIFNRIDEALGADAKNRAFIGLSATPYELHDIEAVWCVNQYLTSAYCGFNYFGGKVIDEGATVTPPKTISFGDFGREINLPFLKNVSLNAYDSQPRAFARFAKSIGYGGTQTQYRAEVEATLRAAILHMAKSGSTAQSGICIRLFNNNIRSHRLIESLKLPEDQIEVIEYFGSDHRGYSVKRAIRQRSNPHLPFLIAVTNRARMGDAFPRGVEWFLEFSKKAANLNALLQGLLGRACGYGKKSTVVMSDDNAALVEDYKRERGGYIYETIRHSVIVGPYRRGAPTSLVRVRRDMNDPLVAEFFKRLDREVVAPHLIQPSATLRSSRARDKGFRTGPILRIADELGLFEHLESTDVRQSLFPTYPEFRIARADDEVKHAREPDRKLRYTLDTERNCRFTFREWQAGLSNHGGARSRGYGANDANDRQRAGDTLEPQVNMRKFDPATGQPIDDKRTDDGDVRPPQDRREGNWRAEMITLPLVAAVRELQAGEVTYPVPHSAFADLLSEDEMAEAILASQ